MNDECILGERDLGAFLNDSNMLSMVSDGGPLRTNSTFDTHIQVQQREKYFDKLGIDGGSGIIPGTPQQNNQKAESRRVSRGLSNFDFVSPLTLNQTSRGS
jgi:hypothetical protein